MLEGSVTGASDAAIQQVVISNLRRISVIEAVSYLALLVATLLKRTHDAELGVQILGPVHGLLYLVFAAMFIARREALGWMWSKTIAALVIGSLPFGGFWLDQQWLSGLTDPGTIETA
jgi:integral membrane protein